MARPPLLIIGVVLDARDRPVADASVYLISGPTALPDIAALTGARGEFRFAVPVPGRYEVGASAEGFSTARASLNVSARETQVRIVLKPSA